MEYHGRGTMSIDSRDTRIADSVWPAVERAIRNRPRLPGPTAQLQVDRMTEWFTGEVIRAVAREMDRAGFRVPEEC
jgi:hypothetical protein